MHLNVKLYTVSQLLFTELYKKNQSFNANRTKYNMSFHANRTKCNVCCSQSSWGSTSIFLFQNWVCLICPFPSFCSIHVSTLLCWRWFTPGNLVIPSNASATSVKKNKAISQLSPLGFEPMPWSNVRWHVERANHWPIVQQQCWAISATFCAPHRLAPENTAPKVARWVSLKKQEGKKKDCMSP